MILLFICGLYLKYEWNQYNEIASSEAIKLAKALEAMIRPQDIETLSVGPEDIEAPEYIMAKTSLMRLVEAIDRIHYAYIIIEQNNNFFI